MTSAQLQRPAPADSGITAPRLALVLAVLTALFLAVGGQLLRLAWSGQIIGELNRATTDPSARSVHRPTITDRKGRLLAADVELPSLFADPALIVDVEESLDHLAEQLADFDSRELRPLLADKSRRFVWLKRGLSPRQAQTIHDLGLPGLGFRMEPRRVYPQGTLAGHLIGYVGLDNQGLAGIERLIDESRATDSAAAAPLTPLAPVMLTLDLGVQAGLEIELADAMRRYQAAGAAGVLLEADTGAVIAAASLPGVDPMRPADWLNPDKVDRVAAGTYELGSIFKVVTIAQSLDAGLSTPDKIYDVRAPLRVGPYTIRDLHPAGRPLSVRDIFVQSSNVGAGMMALEMGPERLRAFHDKLGLSGPLRWEAGAIAAARSAERWGKAETITISYGHGIAVAPLRFAAASAALVNGGRTVTPTLLLNSRPGGEPRSVLSAETSLRVRELMRRNVTVPTGTGRRADVAGLEIGGKTGTAEMPGERGYTETSVISSFLAVLPASQPRYVLLLLLFEPKPTAESRGQIVAGLTAAPTAGRFLARVAPLLDMPLTNP